MLYEPPPSHSSFSASLSSKEGIRSAFVVAWIFCLIFYFAQFALRAAPGVMVPPLTEAFTMSEPGVTSLVGLYYYAYAVFALIAGVLLDRYGARYVIPTGITMVAAGAILFGSGQVPSAQTGRLLQGAGGAFALTGAVYLATYSFRARYLASAIGLIQAVGMLGGSAGSLVVASLIHGPYRWHQFWLYSGIAVLGVAVVILLVTPTPQNESEPKPMSMSMRSLFLPYRVVLSNPQSYLCGLAAGLLFLPTTVGDMIWGVAFLRDAWHIGSTEVVLRTMMVPLGWVIGCPLLGYLADRLGRRKPVLIGAAFLMLIATLAILYLQHLPPYLARFLLGFGSGAAMIPYTMIKEANPDWVKGSATGLINFMVFTMTALTAPLCSWLLNGGAALNPTDFQQAGTLCVVGIVIAIILSGFIRETGGSG